jgi:hypothetical protein
LAAITALSPTGPPPITSTVSRLQIEHIEHRASPGHDPAAQRAKQRQRHVLVHLHHILRGHHRMGGKGGLAEEMAADFAGAIMQASGTIRAAAAEIERGKLLAIGGMAGPAGIAFRQAAKPSTTWSPGTSPETSAPTASTTPAPSCPSTAGKGVGST